MIGKYSVLKVRALDSGASGSGSSRGRGHCIVYIGQDTLLWLTVTLHPGVYCMQMSASQFNAGGNPAMDWHPIQGGVEILLAALCF